MHEFTMEMCKYSMDILTKSKNMDKVMEFVELCTHDIGCQKSSKQLTLVGEELAYNIFSYAYDNTPGTFSVKILICPKESKVTMEFRDEGKPFNPLEAPTPELDLHISERKIGGLGIMLSKELTDRQIYRYENGQNVLQIEKIIKLSD